MQKTRRRRSLVTEINVVPYIDVMLVLLIIFMVTTPLLTQGVQVDLPQAQAKVIDSKEQEPVIITVDAAGRYFLNVNQEPEAVLTEDMLTSRLSAYLQVQEKQGHKPPVLVKGDKDVNYGSVVQAMVLLQQTGVDNVGLMTESPASKKEKPK